MKAVMLREYGGPEKLRFEDNFPKPQIGSGASSCPGMKDLR
jgi:hypothetical protein